MKPRRFDVCNGDADGLCAVRQWRMHRPVAATLVTGLKREIDLLQRVPVDAADEVLVCDLSLQRNREALLRLLAAGVRVRYFDHHAAGEVPSHALLEAHLDMGSAICSSLLMDRHLGGRFRSWALVGAYGDNLATVADPMAVSAGIDAGDRDALRRLGEVINYNAYGDDEGDVTIAPARLYELMAQHADPLRLAREPIVDVIDHLRRADLAQALAVEPHWTSERTRVVVLPDAGWSRRVIGCLANELANAQPRQAHAILKTTGAGDFVASVRAPLVSPHGASEFCARFGGAGRAAAGGIDHLPAQDLQRFVEAFDQAW
jgi:single-stranded DNA-specific DHH superfamily exonuclease